MKPQPANRALLVSAALVLLLVVFGLIPPVSKTGDLFAKYPERQSDLNLLLAMWRTLNRAAIGSRDYQFKIVRGAVDEWGPLKFHKLSREEVYSNVFLIYSFKVSNANSWLPYGFAQDPRLPLLLDGVSFRIVTQMNGKASIERHGISCTVGGVLAHAFIPVRKARRLEFADTEELWEIEIDDGTDSLISRKAAFIRMQRLPLFVSKTMD